MGVRKVNGFHGGMHIPAGEGDTSGGNACKGAGNDAGIRPPRLEHLPLEGDAGGLGGRSISKENIGEIYDALLAGKTDGKETTFLNLRRDICGTEC